MFKLPFKYDKRANSDATCFSSDLPSMTQQEFKKESDINEIVNRFLKTGQLPANLTRPQYADILGLPTTYKEALDHIRGASDVFLSIPAKIRREFNNNPVELLKFVSDSKNLERGIEMGLFKRPPPPPASAPAPAPEK